MTDNIIATSGPSSTYPQRAYRNPLDALVKFLDSKHGDNWAIWEFRAEGTGYPDSEVYGRVWHYPWPDHHPPPFKLIPLIMGGMRNWLKDKEARGQRVVVVHCKAGKGRSGTVSVSYLISEEGWTVEDALKRFTERRMRPGFGAGVSIPSQLRWVGYVDRWTKGGNVYVERQVEVLEVHVWGLKDGVKIAVEGFVDDGQAIKTFHTFGKHERTIVKDGTKERANTSTSLGDESQNGAGRGGGDVMFRPSSRVVLPTNDINIDFERRNKATYGWTMVTSVAHVWFNAFFEGNGPENNGKSDDSGVFQTEWDKMDGIKGSSKKGIRAFDKLAVVWCALDGHQDQPHIVINEPKEGEKVPRTRAADWKGADKSNQCVKPDLGLRVSSPASAEISRANSIQSLKDEATAAADEDHDMLGVRSHGPKGGEQVVPPKGGLLPTSKDLRFQRTHSFSEGDASSTEPEVLSNESHHSSVAGELEGTQHVSTSDLPGGIPEEDMRTRNGHALGHMKQAKNISTGS